ncbi:hypothetical protein [Chromobacterium haemolyticum]|uniref:hypothetical protein n=1 Tax=Chromobacterium haemolyticum TaxID=394935 RepID=UPI001178AEA9|nr:hypothetical protein [Chromobacterium haemolyticum]
MALILKIPFSQSKPCDMNKVKIGGGICYGLCLWLIETAATLNPSDFLQYFRSFALKPGKLMETGLTYQKRANDGLNDSISGLVFNIDIAQGGETDFRESLTSAYMLLEAAVTDKAYILTFYGKNWYGKNWGHATVLLKKAGQCYWFDPNYGLYDMDPIDATLDLAALLKSNYPTVLTTKLHHLSLS